MPKQNIIYKYYFYNDSFDPRVHQILMDLVNKPRYNWRKRYQRVGKNQCQSSKKTNIILWKISHHPKSPEKGQIESSLLNYFTKVSMHWGERKDD